MHDRMGLASLIFCSRILFEFPSETYSAPCPVTLGHRYETSAKKTCYLNFVVLSNTIKEDMGNPESTRTLLDRRLSRVHKSTAAASMVRGPKTFLAYQRAGVLKKGL